MGVISTVLYIQSQIMWQKIYFRESQRTEEKAAVLHQQLRAEVTTAPKTSVKTAGVMSEIRIGNLPEASE